MKALVIDKPGKVILPNNIAAEDSSCREQMKKITDSQNDYTLLSPDETKLQKFLQGDYEYPIYVSSEYLSRFINLENVRIFFELQASAFYQKWLGLMENDFNKKGVLRIRRKSRETDFISKLRDDIFVLSQLFGPAISIHVNQSSKGVTLVHLIGLVKFESGAIAHLEYTTSLEETITFDWSGNKQIVEFNSTEMNPIEPSLENNPLQYSVENIVACAFSLDHELKERLSSLEKRLRAGGEIL